MKSGGMILLLDKGIFGGKDRRSMIGYNIKLYERRKD